MKLVEKLTQKNKTFHQLFFVYFDFTCLYFIAELQIQPKEIS